YVAADPAARHGARFWPAVRLALAAAHAHRAERAQGAGLTPLWYPRGGQRGGRAADRGGPGAAAAMSTLAAYFAMGGYAAFVWPAYAIAAAVLAGLAICSWRRYRA